MNKDRSPERAFSCVIGPDSGGNTYTEIVRQSFAKSCNKEFCFCTDLGPIECTLGPDSRGNFLIFQSSWAYAQKNCEIEDCVCNTNKNYAQIVQDRKVNSVDQIKDLGGELADALGEDKVT